MSEPCDCCTGPVAGLLPPANRPGLGALSYRIGTYASFFAAMQAGLSSADLPELAALTTREKNDASIALLDAWAVVGDVLTFYQERIANEGYLRTAVERRSILELARLVGYALRPGVAASVFLAYTLEKDAAPVQIPQGARSNSIPAPGEQMQAFETAEPLWARDAWNDLAPRRTQPQTAASIAANGLYLKGTATRLKVNDPLLVDLADGQGAQWVRIDAVEPDSDRDRTRIVLRGLNAATSKVAAIRTLLAKYRAVDRFDVSPDGVTTRRVLAVLAEIERNAGGDPAALAAHLGGVALPQLAREVEAAREGHFTKLLPWLQAMHADLEAAAPLDAVPRPQARAAALRKQTSDTAVLGGITQSLLRAPSVPPPGARQLGRSVDTAFALHTDTVPRLLAAVQPPLAKVFYAAWRNLPPPVASQVTVHALRVAAAPFGHNAPLRQTGIGTYTRLPTFGEWVIDQPFGDDGGIGVVLLVAGSTTSPPPAHHEPGVLLLDGEYDIAPDSKVVVEKADGAAIVVDAPAALVHRSLAAYGLSGKTVQIDLPAGTTWYDANQDDFAVVRNSRVFAGSEALELTEEPVTEPVAGDRLELDSLYEDLEAGRWAIVSGERADVLDAAGEPVAGVKAAELVMLAAVEQTLRTDAGGEPLAGDRVHTFLTFAQPLAYTYTRTSVKVYGNVVKATHGETRQETLGSGAASQTLQQFTLKQPPLTYVSAPTVAGVASTLEVRVNDVKWHEADSLAALQPDDPRFITRTDDDARTTVVFGSGARGARLPTGQENVKATYRNGIGKPGNVKAAQITLLNTRPLGVKEVINPIRASGGADKETRDQARKNAPLAVMALDRLVSTQDYADFARTFGGVGKAVATRLSDGRNQVVCVTIAGVDDAPIEPTSDLYRNLLAALRRFGDPFLPVRLLVRERLALVVSANVRIDPDYLWDAVEPKIRAAMLAAFGFETVELGEDVLLARAIRVMQEVAGVVYVDVDVFDAISESGLLAGFSAPAAAKLERRDRVAIEPGRLGAGAPSRMRSTPGSVLLAAQVAYLAPEVPDTLILQELKP